MQLTPQQLKDFNELGYLVLPNCFSGEEIAVLRSEAEGIFDIRSRRARAPWRCGRS